MRLTLTSEKLTTDIMRASISINAGGGGGVLVVTVVAAAIAAIAAIAAMRMHMRSGSASGYWRPANMMRALELLRISIGRPR